MPRMQSAAVQCCMCITGVFMFLGGVIMLATGICLILNYGVFDVELLPPDLQNDEGKKTVGIILTCCGLVAVIISVIVSLLYLCNKTKSPVVIPDDLTRIPASARNQTPDRSDRVVRTDRTVSEKTGERRSSSGKPSHGGSMGGRPASKSIPGSTEVVLPRQGYKRKHKKYPRRRLEGIIEQDAVSRKTQEGVLAAGLADRYDDTPRSGSFSSEMTNDELRIPKVVLDHHDDLVHDRERRLSSDSASTCQTVTSDMSISRFVNNDKSRRELQFIPSTVLSGQDAYDPDDSFSKDSVSILQKDDTSVMYSRGRDSEESSIVSNFADRGPDSSLSNNNTETSAGGSYTQADTAQMTSHTPPAGDDSPNSLDTADTEEHVQTPLEDFVRHDS